MPGARKGDAVSTLSSIRVVWKENNIALVEWDLEGEKVNKLNATAMLRLEEVLNELEEKKCSAALFISRKPGIFIAGADIKEIQSFSPEEFQPVLKKAHELFNRIEDAAFPVVCAIEGACLGGGLELAMACDYRIASDHPKTILGLPEVKLGLIPGFGGCYRLPHLVSIAPALDMIASGKVMSAKKARKLGFVDEAVSVDILEKRAWEFTCSLPPKKARRLKSRGFKEMFMNSFVGRPLVAFLAKRAVLQKTKGFYPAPIVAVETLSRIFPMPREAALELEMEAFSQVVTTDVSKNLIRLFFATEAAKKNPFASSSGEGSASDFLGVLGAGVMGAGISYTAAHRGVDTRLVDISESHLVKAKQQALALFQAAFKRRRLSKGELQRQKSLLSFTKDYKTLKTRQVVIEAVTEDPAIKTKILSSLSENLSSDCIVATNTSSLRVSDLAKCYKHPKNFVGMHFFNPVPKMPLVEIIKGDSSSEQALSRVFSLAKKMGKTAVVVKDSPCFLVNRILTPLLIESIRLVREGVSFSMLDQVYEGFGMPMGPCRLCDEVGFPVARSVLSNYSSNFSHMGKEEFWDIAEDTQGLSTSKGFYTYNSKRVKVAENKDLYTSMKVRARVTSLSAEDILQRGLFLMVNEAARAFVEEKIVSDALMFDLCMIMGIGFPPFRGGLLQYADTVGVDKIIQTLKIYEKKYGEHYAPSSALMSLSGKSFTAL